jgi:hypothetical protein
VWFIQELLCWFKRSRDYSKILRNFFFFLEVNVWVNNQLKHPSQHTKIAQIMNVLAQCGSSGSSSTHSAKYRALYIFSVYNAVPNYFNYNFNNVKYLIEYLIRVSDINMHNRKCVKPLPVNTLLLLLKGTSYLPCKAMAHSHKSRCGPHCHFEMAQLVS